MLIGLGAPVMVLLSDGEFEAAGTAGVEKAEVVAGETH
jgi:hypothetical protein